MPATPLPPDRHLRLLAMFTAAGDRLSADRARAVVLAILVAAGAADYALARGATMSLFYAAAIVLAAWRLGRGAGFAAAAAAMALAAIASHHAGAGLTLATTWNLVVNAAGACLLVGLAVTLRATIEHERARASADPLTGVLNRAAFFDRLASVSAGRHRERLLLACVDLDGFKAVNDERGHAAGDRLLVQFTRAVADALAEDEVIARIGGDEFAMILALAPGEDAGQRARRLHRHLAETLAAGDHPVTCSAGATPISRGLAHDGGALLAVADAAMYEVKRAGRDGIRLVDDGAREADGARLRLVAGEAS